MIGFLLWLLSMAPRSSVPYVPSAPPSAPPPAPSPRAPRARKPARAAKPPRVRPTPRARDPRAVAAKRAARAQRAAQAAQAAQALAAEAAAKKARRKARRRSKQHAAAQAAQQQAAAQSAQQRAPRKKRKKKRKPKADRVTRANLVKIPGQWWIPWDPAPADLTALAQQKLDELWQSGEGTTRVIPLDDGRIVGLLTIEVDGERGVSVWRLRPGTVIPDGVFPPREELEEMQDEAEQEAVVPEPVDDEEDEELEDEELEDEDEDEPQLLTHLPTLMQGNQGPDVVTLQKALGMSGSLGFFGPSTAQKVREFQASEGLDDDGIVGPETWTALLT